MTKIKKSLKSFCSILSLSVSVILTNSLITQYSSAAQIEKSQILFQQYLLQERSNASLVSKTLKVGDVTWSYSEGGMRAKPTILLIHGLSGTRDDWNRVAKFLTPSYHVIIPDLPTNGETKTPENFDVSIPNVTSQLRMFIEALNINEKLNIAGHSLGGSIATVYASQYPFDTQSLFLLNSAGIYKLANTPYSKNPSTLKNLIVTKLGDLADISKQLMQNPPNIPFPLKNAQEKLLISQSEQTLKAVDQIIMLNRVYTPESFARLTKSIEAPTLILWGKQDRIFNFEVAKELYSLLKRPETPIILNNVGHMPILEAEKQVAQYYLPFLAKTQTLKNPLADKLIPLN